jgi:DNA-directed RNA polymerase specialized sigma24 family protein
VSWREALEALPASCDADPVSRFAQGRILLHFAPRARNGNEAVAAAMDGFLASVAYTLPGHLWIRLEQELYLERHLGRRVERFRTAHDPVQDALQVLSMRLLERALDTYRPGPQREPHRWVSEILKNIRIDRQRKFNTEARVFDPTPIEVLPEELHGHHGSAEEEVIAGEIHEVIRQMGAEARTDERRPTRSRQMSQALSRALTSLSDNQLSVLYLSLFPPADRDAGIASLLGTSLMNIRKRRHDALKALRHALKRGALV